MLQMMMAGGGLVCGGGFCCISVQFRRNDEGADLKTMKRAAAGAWGRWTRLGVDEKCSESVLKLNLAKKAGGVTVTVSVHGADAFFQSRTKTNQVEPTQREESSRESTAVPTHE